MGESMSNPMYARIKIYGEAPKACLEDLYKSIKKQFEYSCLDEKELLKPNESYEHWFKRQLGKGKCLDYSDGEANYGQFDDLEQFLQENNIIYIRESAGDSCDCVPEVVYFDGKEVIAQETNSDNNPIVSVQTVKDLCNTAMEMEQEFKKGNAPIYATEPHDTVQSIMAKYTLSKSYTPNGAELIKAYLDHEYKDIPNEDSLPPFTIKE